MPRARILFSTRVIFIQLNSDIVCIHLDAKNCCEGSSRFSDSIVGYIIGYICSLILIFAPQGHVVMGTQAVSVYQQVIEKTKGLSFRSQELFNGIEKRLGIKDKDSVSNVHLLDHLVMCVQ